MYPGIYSNLAGGQSIFLFTLSSMAAGANTGDVTLTLQKTNINIMDFTVSSFANTLSVSLKQKASCIPPDIDELLSVNTTGKIYRHISPQVDNAPLTFINQDSPQNTNLYMKITNVDAVNTTGTITIRMRTGN